MRSLSVERLKYNHIVGTGGIGSGIFFSLDGDHTLGRNESRLGYLESYRDYCKQHIIMHYIAVLLGSGDNRGFSSYPIGKVGDDAIGKQLLSMMEQAGMDTRYVVHTKNASTLFSVCFQYPDHSGGNITTGNSASNLVTPSDIDAFFSEYHLNGNEGIVLAAPEVPVATRIRLLRHGKNHGMFNVASVLSSEVEEFSSLGGFELTELLAVNIDEARQIAGLDGEQISTPEIISACRSRLQETNPEIAVVITDGAQGSYCFYQGETQFTPAIRTKVISTAGAGDAFLSGTITGLCCGLPLTKVNSLLLPNSTVLQTAIEFGTVLASLKVTTADTIHEGANGGTVFDYICHAGLHMSDTFKSLFQPIKNQ